MAELLVKQGTIKSVVGVGEEDAKYGKKYEVTFDDGTVVFKNFKGGPKVEAGQKWHVKYEVKGGQYAGNYVKDVIDDNAPKTPTTNSDWKPDPLKAAVEIGRVCLNDAVTLYGVPNIKREDKDGAILDYSSSVLTAYDKFFARVSETVKKLATEL